LIPTVDGKRAAAIEILLNTPRVADLVKKGDVAAIKEVMLKSENVGMQTFDSALLRLFKAGKISEEEALKNADSRNNLRLKIQLDEDASVESKPKPAPAAPVSKTEAKAEVPKPAEPEKKESSSFSLDGLSLMPKDDENKEEE